MAVPTLAQDYGADQSGLVYGYRIHPGGHAVSLDSKSAEAWLQTPSNPAEDDFIWLHFNLAHAATEKWMRQHLVLSDEFYEALHAGSRSTRIELDGESLLGVMNDVVYDFSLDGSDTSTLWISVDQRTMITARQKSLRSVERLRASLKRGEAFRSPAELLVHLMRDQADVLAQIVRDSVAKTDPIEDDILSGQLDRTSDLGNQRRVLVRLQRLLAPEPAAMFRLLNRPPRWMKSNDLLELRQATEEFSAVLVDISSLQERIKLLQEESASQLEQQNSRSLYVLTVVTVMALPINLTAGLFGMNVGGIPLAQDGHGFLVIVLSLLVFTVLLTWLIFRKRPRG